MADGVFDALTVVTTRGTLRFVDGVFTVTTPGGELSFGFDAGNELRIRSAGNDPPKLRIEAPPGVMQCISFNDVIDGVAQEHTLLTARSDEQQPASLGGQLTTSIRARYCGGDEAMRRMQVISAAYTDDGAPVVRTHPSLGPFTEAPLPAPNQAPAPPVSHGAPSAVVSLTNLSGTLAAVQTAGDGQWLTVIDSSQDTGCELDLPLSGQTWLEVEVRQVGPGTPPYVYVWVGGVLVIDAVQPGGHVVLGAPIAAYHGVARVQIRGAAQGGTLEIGGIRAR